MAAKKKTSVNKSQQKGLVLEKDASALIPASTIALADQYIDRADSQIICDQQSLDDAGALLADLKRAQDNLEGRRTALVKPLNDHVRWINAQFKTTSTKLDRALLILGPKMRAYMMAEKKRQDEASKAATQTARSELLAEAERARADGDEQAAEQLESIAALPVTTTIKTVAQGDSGSKTRGDPIWLGEVVDPMEVMKAVVEGKLPRGVISIEQGEINKWCKLHKVEETIHGIRVYSDLKLVTNR